VVQVRTAVERTPLSLFSGEQVRGGPRGWTDRLPLLPPPGKSENAPELIAMRAPPDPSPLSLPRMAFFMLTFFSFCERREASTADLGYNYSIVAGGRKESSFYL